VLWDPQADFDTHAGLETLHGTLIEADQTTARSVQIGDPGDNYRDGDPNKNQGQPKARRKRRATGENCNERYVNNQKPNRLRDAVLKGSNSLVVKVDRFV